MIKIGERIREELTRQERTISWLARKLNCQRSGVYRILHKNSIDIQLLIQISQILHHNFISELAEEAEC